MTVKQFFKGKAFKCILVLLLVLLFSGAILTIAYGFLEVSDGERLQRAVNKIYPNQSVTIYGKDDAIITAEDKNPQGLLENAITLGDAKVLSAYKITFTDSSDIHYLVQSKGMRGYAEGTVTCWVALNVNVETKVINNIAKVQVGESSGQTFMDKITNSMLNSFTQSIPEGGFSTSDGYISVGATKSSNAICNAVNGAVDYVNSVLFNKAETSPYEELALTDYVNVRAGKTQATLSENSSDLEYTVYTKGYGNANDFTIKISVGSDKLIKSYEILKNGSTGNYANYMPQSVLDGTLFIGKGTSYFTDIYGENMVYKKAPNLTDDTVQTGATASNSIYLCMYAGAFATQNYDAVVTILNGGVA
ncbi:MAG: hypothetical protein ACI4MS_07225 [Candidatus Coproplasma sp.]